MATAPRSSPAPEAKRARGPLAARFAQARARRLDLGGDLLVLAPHPDDETLGCGGTIARSRAAGARVTVAFLTDGSGSHRRFLAAEGLRAMRRAEAIAAAEVLGVGEGDLRFLDHPDGELETREAQALGEVQSLVRELSPGAVLAPCPWDVTPDHLVAARLGRTVAAIAGIPLHGYATWFWDRWPWTSTRSDGLGRTGARAALGHLRLLREFRTVVDIGDVRDLKRRALAEHRSQMERPAGVAEWPVLPDVADGRLLDLLVCDHELFATIRE